MPVFDNTPVGLFCYKIALEKRYKMSPSNPKSEPGQAMKNHDYYQPISESKAGFAVDIKKLDVNNLFCENLHNLGFPAVKKFQNRITIRSSKLQMNVDVNFFGLNSRKIWIYYKRSKWVVRPIKRTVMTSWLRKTYFWQYSISFKPEVSWKALEKYKKYESFRIMFKRHRFRVIFIRWIDSRYWFYV